jgi:glycosyltransferase involved in cell wall biosynthesis
MGKYFHEKGHDVYYYSTSNIGNIETKFGTVLHPNESGGITNSKNIDHLKATLKKVKPNIVINQMPPEAILRKVLAEERNSLQYKLIGCLRNSLFKVKDDFENFTKIVLPKVLYPIFNNALGKSFLFFLYTLQFRRRLKSILDLHDYYILLAPPNIDELKYYVGNYKFNKVRVIPNSIPDVEDSTHLKEKIILHVGRLEITQKRSDLLLPIWEKIEKNLPEWRFVVLGDGPYLEEMKALIKTKNITRVTLAGFQNPDPYYKSASVFLMTSAYEGFPNVIIEAQSYGAVTVAFDTYKVLSWICKNGEDSILIKPYEIELMASKVTELCKNEQILRQMSKASLENASKFTIKAVGDQWINFFNEII